MLWTPLGQYDFLLENWMKIGTYVAPFLLFMFFSSRTEQTDSIFSDVKLMSVFMLIAYIIHQYEEHWIDVLGERYAFYSYVNTLISDLLNAQNQEITLLTPAAIFVINTSLVWLVGIIAIWRSPGHLFPALAMSGIVVVNAVSHIIAGMAQGSYNPGLLTAIVVLLPLGIAFYTRVIRTTPVSKVQVQVSIIWAVVAHLVMFAGLFAANWFQLFSESVYFAILILWSVMPVFLFNSTSEQTIQQTRSPLGRNSSETG